ncbi:MAG: hypothetical protein PHU23_04610 [Dehalococcoidales bacterium]|nr:hypothetical protein [Dehalococcoidales bacterium]
MEDSIITFRGHKVLESWFEYAAGKGGFRGQGELLRLILMKAAFEQATESGVSRFLQSLTRKDIAVGVGDTKVFACRVIEPVRELIENVAEKNNKTISEWCYGVMLEWNVAYSKTCQQYQDRGDAWCANHALILRQKVCELADVYAQKTGNKLSGIMQ